MSCTSAGGLACRRGGGWDRTAGVRAAVFSSLGVDAAALDFCATDGAPLMLPCLRSADWTCLSVRIERSISADGRRSREPGVGWSVLSGVGAIDGA